MKASQWAESEGQVPTQGRASGNVQSHFSVGCFLQAGKIMVTANAKGETSTMPNELKTLNKYNYKVKG